MTTSPDIIEQLRKEPGGEDLDLSWLDQPLAERGLRVAPGKRGLTLEDIATTSYGDIPATTNNHTGRMRGAAPRSDAQRSQKPGARSPRLVRFGDAALRRGRAAPVEQRHRRAVGRHARTAGRDRARDVAAVHLPHAGRVHRRRRAGQVRTEHQRRVLRNRTLPRQRKSWTKRATSTSSASARWRTASACCRPARAPSAC